MNIRILQGITATALLSFALATAHAAPVSITCNEPDDGRLATLNFDDSNGSMACGPAGTTNQQPSGQYWSDLGYLEFDKVEDGIGNGISSLLTITGLGGTSGTFSIDPAAFDIPDLHIVFKFGWGRTDPDWISFQLNPNGEGVWSGDWSVTGRQALSHVALVPEPTTLLLLGAGLLSLALVRRFRRFGPVRSTAGLAA